MNKLLFALVMIAPITAMERKKILRYATLAADFTSPIVESFDSHQRPVSPKRATVGVQFVTSEGKIITIELTRQEVSAIIEITDSVKK